MSLPEKSWHASKLKITAKDRVCSDQLQADKVIVAGLQSDDCLQIFAGSYFKPAMLERPWSCISLLLASIYIARAQSDLSDTSILLQASFATEAGWNTSVDLCSWPGITCNNRRVKSM